MGLANFGELLGFGYTPDIGDKREWVFSCDRCGREIRTVSGNVGVSFGCECGGNMERNWRESKHGHQD